MNTKSDGLRVKDVQAPDLTSEVAYRDYLQEICNKIYAANNLDEILIDLKEDITHLFKAQRITVFVVDGKTRELVSRFKSGPEISEIRIPISVDSIAGFTASKQKPVNIKDVYDTAELNRMSPNLKFDRSWDQKTGFRTRQVLAYPIVFKKFLLGVLQLINCNHNEQFTSEDVTSAAKVAEIIGIAVYNQKRIAGKARPNRFSYLLDNHFITQKELDKAVAESRRQKKTIEDVLIRDYDIAKKDVGQSLSKFYDVPFIEYYSAAPVPGDLMSGLRIPFLERNCWVPLRTDGRKVVIAIDNPSDLQKIDEIKALFPGRPLTYFVAFKQDILSFIKLFTQADSKLEGIDDILADMKEEEAAIEEAETAVGEEDSAVVKLVNKIILDAYSRGASDVHIEPYAGRQDTEVRIRVDGACTLYQKVPFQFRNALASRIKIMANLDIAERRKPQDGKIQFKKYSGQDIELRVATVPTQGGMEDIVLRILAAGEPIPLSRIGFSSRNHEKFMEAINQPYGIIFVCGPTGSGKTTTLHSALSAINKTDTKIWTAEDPVEITQRGLRQVQVKPQIGFDFATAMRSFLRADPDVIMVGEMRDKETTHIGIEASLTGHLVLSTLHTNNAPESITRLLDMGMDPFNFADAVLCILAQRLVRTLCRECKRSYHPSEEQLAELMREYGGKALFEQKTDVRYSEGLKLYKPNGCESCNRSGYAGRMGLHELLVGTDEMKKLIQNKARIDEIRNLAIEEGMTTLKQDGVEKIFEGNCDLLQVRKVTIK
ncbi:MAG: GspE/PulE family protein [Desulfobacterales bacterium]|nr:GspE/PulE family protein [Desulfobacterales bacterium]